MDKMLINYLHPKYNDLFQIASQLEKLKHSKPVHAIIIFGIIVVFHVTGAFFR